jgi:hypothetical protein
MKVSIAVVLVCLLGGGTARASEHHHHHHEHKADAHVHLQKANKLAGEGKCAAAVKEFTAAYAILQDPIVLFNRAECYRRLGQNAEAAADYRGFLKGFPAAPNRAEIEARIATLEKPAPPKPPVGAPKPPAGAPASPPVARAPGGTQQPPASPPSPARTPPAIAKAPPPPVSPVAPPAVSPNETMPFLPPPPPQGGDATTLVEAPRSTPAEAPKAEASHGSRWWVWTTLAVVAAGGGFAAYWYLRPKDQPLPMTTLGNYRF